MDVLKKRLAHDEEWQTKVSLLLGILIWFLHLNVVYGLASLACKWGWFSATGGGISGLQLVETIITLIAMLLILITIYLPWRHWRSFQTEKPPKNPHMLQDTEKDRRPLLAFVTALTNSLFLLFVIAAFIPIFALNACGQV
jgi:uncharacterized membrane protein